MPPRGTTLSLSDFHGQSLTTSTPALPSTSSGLPPRDRRDGGDRPRRYDEDSRADGPGRWRSEGGTGGGDGGAKYGFSDGVDRDRVGDAGGRGDEAGNWRTGRANRFGNDRGGDRGSERYGGDRGGSDRFGRGGGYGGRSDRGDRFGGDRGSDRFGGDRGGDRFSGGAGRPAGMRLNLTKRGEAGTSQPLGPASISTTSRAAREAAEQQVDPLKRQTKLVKAKVDLRTEAREFTGGKSTVKLSDKDSALQTAMRDRAVVDVKQLAEGLGALDLSDEVQASDLSRVLVLSLDNGKLALQELTGAVAVDTLVTALKDYQGKYGEKALRDLVKRSKTDVSQVVCPDESRRAAFLADHALLALVPVAEASLKQEVEGALAQNADAPDAVLSLIGQTVGAKVSVADALADPVVDAVVKLMFAKEKADISVLDKYVALLQRVVSDVDSQAKLVTKAAIAWFDKGMEKDVILELFKKFFSLKVVSAFAFMAWRDNKANKHASKRKALVKVNSFLTEIEPKEPQEEASEAENEGDEIKVDY